MATKPMKQATVHPDLSVEIVSAAIPVPTTSQVLIKVEIAGSNPKDWYLTKSPVFSKTPTNSGDDIAGTIHAVGEDVVEFKVGDRVAAFHEMFTPHGAFAEFAIAPSWTTFHVPKGVSFEEAATIPLAALTAAVGLYACLKLPEPWQAAKTPIPLIVYGAAGAVGSFAVKLAKLSNIHPIIAVAGKGKAHVETLIDRSRGDNIVDYREGDEAVIKGMKDAVKKAGQEDVMYAWDAVSDHGSFQNISKVLKEGGHITVIRPEADYSAIPETMNRSVTYVGVVNQGQKSSRRMAELTPGGHELGLVWSRLFTKGLQEGWFSGHPYEVRPGGLGGVEGALKDLQAGKASAVKYLFRIADTQGVGGA